MTDAFVSTSHPRPFTEAERYWHLDRLRAYPDFVEFEPAWAWDGGGEDVASSRRVLKFHTIREMARQANLACEKHMGQKPPCKVALFVSQFPSRDFEDCVYAHWALHADKHAGPEYCCAAITIEPFEWPDDAEEIQYWATWHLTRHPWDIGPARQYAEKLARSTHPRWSWVSDRAKALLWSYIEDNHKNLEAWKAQGPYKRHPMR